MVTNISSFFNASVPSSSEPKLPLDIVCFLYGPSSLMVAAYFITSILLLLPFSFIVLHHGLQQWQQKHFSSATTNHSDHFTYHLVIIELIGVFGHFISLFGIFCHKHKLFLLGFYLFSFTWFGEIYFHALTCLERYLAVVHPVTYLSLRSKRGIKMRNLVICCVWLLCFVKIGLLMEEFYNIMSLCILTLAIVIVFLCSISVLCVLLHSGPGDQRKGTKKIGRSKLRAFYTIVSILGVLVVRFAWSLAWAILFMTKQRMNCLLMTSDLWFNLPCNLVQPLLYLQRAGKLKCFTGGTR